MTASFNEPKATPETPDLQRVTSIDTVRGFALLGVLLINLRSYSGIGTSHPLLRIFLEGKSVSIFSMMFGAGLAIPQWDKREGGPGSLAFLLRRQLLLVLFGCPWKRCSSMRGSAPWIPKT